MAIILSHDYEGAQTPATLGYTNNVGLLVNVAGNGLRGSTYGLRCDSASSSSNKMLGRARVPVTHTGRSFSVSADFDHADWITGFPDGGRAFELSALPVSSNSVFLTLVHGYDGAYAASPDFQLRQSLALFIEATGISQQWVSDADIIVPNTTQNITMCGQMSSAPLVSDGTVSVYLDGVLLVTMTNQPLYGNILDNPPTLGEVYVNPMGRFDNLVVQDSGCASQIIGSTVFGTKGTVTSTRTFLANLDDTTRIVNEPGTFYIGGNLIVTGDTTFSTTGLETVLSTLLIDEDGSIVIDEDGNPLFSEG